MLGLILANRTFNSFSLNVELVQAEVDCEIQEARDVLSKVVQELGRPALGRARFLISTDIVYVVNEFSGVARQLLHLFRSYV